MPKGKEESLYILQKYKYKYIKIKLKKKMRASKVSTNSG